MAKKITGDTELTDMEGTTVDSGSETTSTDTSSEELLLQSSKKVGGGKPGDDGGGSDGGSGDDPEPNWSPYHGVAEGNMPTSQFVAHGDDCNVNIVAKDNGDGTVTFHFSIDFPDGQTGDLRGVFLDFPGADDGETSTFPDGLKVVSGSFVAKGLPPQANGAKNVDEDGNTLITDDPSFVSDEENVLSVGQGEDGANIHGDFMGDAESPNDPFDFGVAIGTQGIAKDDVQEVWFTVMADDDLHLSSFSNVEFGFRVNSVGAIDDPEGREDSKKILEINRPPELEKPDVKWVTEPMEGSGMGDYAPIIDGNLLENSSDPDTAIENLFIVSVSGVMDGGAGDLDMMANGYIVVMDSEGLGTLTVKTMSIDMPMDPEDFSGYYEYDLDEAAANHLPAGAEVMVNFEWSASDGMTEVASGTDKGLMITIHGANDQFDLVPNVEIHLTDIMNTPEQQGQGTQDQWGVGNILEGIEDPDDGDMVYIIKADGQLPDDYGNFTMTTDSGALTVIINQDGTYTWEIKGDLADPLGPHDFEGIWKKLTISDRPADHYPEKPEDAAKMQDVDFHIKLKGTNDGFDEVPD
ncbi:MAG: VCBS domain-containing protein, partial [Pseudomonadota bacterium]